MAMDFLRISIISTLLCLMIHPVVNVSQSFLRRRISEGPPYLDGDEGFIRITVSEKGLIYAKDLLVAEALKSLTSLHVADIKKSLDVPFVGSVAATLSHVTLSKISVPSSGIQLGKSGINIIASEVVANLTMNWRFSYRTWLLPITVTDKGHALVEVKGMEAGIALRLDDENGALNLIPMECGTSIKDIIITLEGGASWFYQGLVDAFEGQIRAAVESAVSEKIMKGIMKLDALLHGLPKEILIDSVAALNVTVMQAPIVAPTSISVGVDGLFVGLNSSDVFLHPVYGSQPKSSNTDPSKMLDIALSERVLNSAAAVYYNAGFLNWLVDKLPDQSLLNTASWRLIIPKLYSKYPNDDMILNISVSSPPIITVTSDGVQAVVAADLIIDVVDSNDAIPVACISLVIVAHGTVEISGNNITGEAGLSDLTLELKWSNVGNFHMRFIQAIVHALAKDVLLPLVNLRLKRGFPLPIIQNFRLQNANILYGQSQIVVWADVRYISDLSN